MEGHRAPARRFSPSLAVVVATLLAAASSGCSSDPAPVPAVSAEARSAPPPVSVQRMPEGQGDVPGWVRSEATAAKARGGRALVYVGAEWCEPCKRFKAAAARGELDAALPGLVLLELDHDRDEAALRELGCTSRMIPLLAVPDADGKCTDRRVEGAIKGEGAVAYMTPKVKALLD